MSNAAPQPSDPGPDDTARQEMVALETQAERSLFRAEWKFLLLVAVALAILLVGHFTPLRKFLGDVQYWKQHLQAAGLWAPLVFCAACILLNVMAVPRLALAAVSGMLFGFVQGLLITQLSAWIGSYVTFLFARWSGRAWVARKLAKRERLQQLLRHPTIATVFFARNLPVTNFIMNLILGITPVRHSTFLAGTFLGLLPSGILATLIGSGLGKSSFAHAISQIGLAMLGLAMGAALLWQLHRKLTRTGASPAPAGPAEDNPNARPTG